MLSFLNVCSWLDSLIKSFTKTLSSIYLQFPSHKIQEALNITDIVHWSIDIGLINIV